MDFYFLPIGVSVLLVAVTVVFISRRSKSKLPPGSYGWPIIGESYEFLFGSPEKFIGDRMKKYSPEIFKTKILGEKTVVLCGAKGNKFLFSNEQKYFSVFRPHPMQHIFRSYKKTSPPPSVPAEIKQTQENLVIRQPGFLKPEALMRYLPLMDFISQQQIREHFEDKEVIEALPMAKTLTLTLACRLFLGINNPDRIARLVKQFDDISNGMHSFMIDFPGTIFYRANRAAAKIRKELLTVVSERRSEIAKGAPVADILSHMIIALGDDKSAIDDEIADKMMGILTAGYSTVATTIAFLMKYLGLNPEIYRKVREEQMGIAESKKSGESLDWEDVGKMKYSWNAICETLRLVPPLQGTFREVVEEFTFNGYTVPKGWKVYWTVSTTNRDPDIFPNPEAFEPSRYDGDVAPPPYTVVPFGGGPRMCPGKEYGRVGILVFLHYAVMKYGWEVVDPDEEVIGGMMPEPRRGLPIKLYPNN